MTEQQKATLNESPSRTCSRCGLKEPDCEFYAGAKRPCKACERLRMKKYREDENVKRREKEYRNKPEVKAKQKTAEAKNRPHARKRWADQTYKLLNLDASDY